MAIPSDEIRAPTPVLKELAGADLAADTLSVFGKAPDLYRLRDFANLKQLWLSGVSPKQISALAGLNGLKSLTIHGLGTERVGEIPDLPGLQSLVVCASPKLRGLDGIEKMPSLRKLILFDTCALSHIDELAALSLLEELCLEGGMSKALTIMSLAPLCNLTQLRRLRLASIRIDDGSLAPLHNLRGLSSVFIANAFSWQVFAQFERAHPGLAFGWNGGAIVIENSTGLRCKKCGASKAMLTGRGLPVLCSVCDAPRIAKHVNAYRAAVAGAD